MLQINAKSIMNGISVESCAEQCVFEDSYLCRSFDYNIDKNVCYLYTENLKDEIFMDLKKNQSLITNHYSSYIKYINIFPLNFKIIYIIKDCIMKKMEH